MATKNYKTLAGLISQAYDKQVTFSNFVSERFFHKNLGWVNFKLNEEEEKKAYKIMASVIFPRKSEGAELMMYYCGNQCSIFDRIRIEEQDGKLVGAYCAGQDYVSEIRFIRRKIRG